MSLIGTLTQIKLSGILQRVEAHAKTGVLIIKQEGQWVELYFRDGHLMCIGPARTDITLIDRLLQAGFISPQAKQEVTLALGASPSSETRIALTLMDMGYITHEGLRTWATHNASQVIHTLLNWPKGDLYFEEGLEPSADRLLIALPLTSLLPPSVPLAPTTPPSAPASTASGPLPPLATSLSVSPGALASSAIVQKQVASISNISRVSTLTEASQFSSGAYPASPPASSLVSRSAPVAPLATPTLSPPRAVPTTAPLSPLQVPTPVSQPAPITTPLAPRPIDLSFLRPEMVLLPTDLSALREQNPRIQLTPDQWRLFTRVNGQTSLDAAIIELGIPRDQICQIAGELITMGLVNVAVPLSEPIQELSPVSKDLFFSHGYIAPGSAANAASPWATLGPITGSLSASSPRETQSPWSNGANEATFVPGAGWVLTVSPSGPPKRNSPVRTVSAAYAQVGGSR